MELPPALAARLGAREAARKEAAASLRQQRSNAGETQDDISADLSKWREAAAALEREARQAGGASTSKSKSADEPFDLDALSARLSELERQAASLAARAGRPREGEALLAGAASAREALRRARAGATPAFSLEAAAGAPPPEGKAEEERKKKEAADDEEGERQRRKRRSEEEAETTASRVADGARDAARLAGLRGETLRLSAASLGVCGESGRCSSSSSSASSSLPSLRLEDLEDCTVVVECPLGALVASGLKRCVVFLACAVGGGGGGGGGGSGGGEKSSRDQNPGGGGGEGEGGGGGAVLVDGASGSTFFLPAHQVRLHRLTAGCDVFVRSAAPPVLEACSALRLGPYPAVPAAAAAAAAPPRPASSSCSASSSSSAPSSPAPAPPEPAPVLPASEASLLAAGLGSDDARRSWSRPRDFSWPLAAAGRPSPHWRRVPAAERRAPPTAAGVAAAPFERLFPPRGEGGRDDRSD